MQQLLTSALLVICLASPLAGAFRKEAFAKEALEKLLQNAGDMNIVEIDREVERILKYLPEQDRKRHLEMRKQTFAEEHERQLKIREVLPKLSIPAKQRLVRIIMVQEHKQLTQNDKRSRLNQIKKTMDPKITAELHKYLTDQQLYRLAF